MIPGITDRTRFPRLGKIRLGEKRVSAKGTEYPAKLPYFNLVDAAAVAAAFPEKPTMLAPMLLPGNPVKTEVGWDFSAYWRTSRSAYGKSSGLFCRCDDGVSAWRVNQGIGDDKSPRRGQPLDPHGFAFIQEQGLDVAMGEMFAMPCPADECPYWQAKRCKNLASFDFMLPTVAGFGTWCIQTSSFNSIRNVESMLQTLATATGGIVAGIPLALQLVPHQAQVDGKAVEVYVLQILCPYNLQQLAGLRRKSLAAGSAVVAAIEGPEPAPDDLFPFGGAALDADLGKGQKPEKTQLAPAPGTSKLDTLTQSMRPAAPEPPDDVIDADPLEDDNELFTQSAAEAEAATKAESRKESTRAAAVAATTPKAAKPKITLPFASI